MHKINEKFHSGSSTIYIKENNQDDLFLDLKKSSYDNIFILTNKSIFALFILSSKMFISLSLK